LAVSKTDIPLISVIVPVFNEGAAIVPHLEVILRELDRINGYRFEMLVIDDGSGDDTIERLEQLAREWSLLSWLALTRNFGKEAAIQAGLENALGDAVIVMDSDLQHPPALIPRMLEAWRGGVEVVEAYKVHRGHEGPVSRWAARGFYRLFQLLTGMDIHNQSDFKLLDRRVVSSYLRLPERERFFRGLVHWLGYPSLRLPFEVPARAGGGSRWTHFRLWRYSISAITSFTSAPLQFITLLGAVTFLLSTVIAVKAIYDKLMGEALGGFTTVILLLLFLGSALMISLGLLGVYIARIHDEIKGRPVYLIGRRSPRPDRRETSPTQHDETQP